MTTMTRIPKRRRLTREQQKAQTRARLLEAAGTVFAQRGYHDASVEEVAEEAGFSKGAVYSNFDSKEELFAALLDERCRRRLVEVETALSGQRLTPARLRQLGDALTAEVRQDPQWSLLFIEFWAHSVRDPRLRPRFAAIWQEARAGLAGLIARHAAEAGQVLPVAPAQLASAAMALSTGLGLQMLADPDRASSESLGNALALLFAGVATLAAYDTSDGVAARLGGVSRGSRDGRSRDGKGSEVAEVAFDPICGREVNEDVWTLEYGGTPYRFCSQACRDDFGNAPRMLISLGPKAVA